MNYFLDTNVIIGYIFLLDNLNKSSEDFISFESSHFYSDHVKKEVDDVCFRNHKQYRNFLLHLSRFFSKFSDNSLINEFEGHKLIDKMNSIGTLDIDEMHDAFNVIWENLDFNINHDAFDVKNKFSVFTNNFQSSHVLRKNYLFNKMTLVPNHTQKDKRILYKIKEEKLRDNWLHGEDENILFDANEFCQKNKNINLEFVTADNDFTEAIGRLSDYLCFDGCINLLEFSSNN